MSLNIKRCQSCGMRLGIGFFGTESDGNETSEYCKFCYQHGQFTQPKLSLDDMINMSIKNMTEDLHMPFQKSHDLANSLIPSLKRWKKSLQ